MTRIKPILEAAAMSTSPYDPHIPLTLTHSFSINAGWSVVPQIQAKWTPVVESGPSLVAKAAIVTFRLDF